MSTSGQCSYSISIHVVHVKGTLHVDHRKRETIRIVDNAHRASNGTTTPVDWESVLPLERRLYLDSATFSTRRKHRIYLGHYCNLFSAVNSLAQTEHFRLQKTPGSKHLLKPAFRTGG